MSRISELKIQTLLITLVVLLSGSLGAQDLVNPLRISGLVFGDYFYNLKRDANIIQAKDVAIGGNAKFNGFQFRRINLTFDYNISSRFSTRLRFEADQQSNTSNGRIGIYVRDAFIRWNDIFKGSDLILGIQPVPAYEISESFWGHRFIEKTIMDLRGAVSSRDFGLSLRGRITPGGSLNYAVMIGNNSGNRPEYDNHKRIYSHIQFSPDENFSLTAYGDYSSSDQIRYQVGNELMMFNADGYTMALFAGYRKREKVSAGAEVFRQTVMNGFKQNETVKDKNMHGVSLFGTWFFNNTLSLAGRYDYFDPNVDTDGDSRNIWIVSFDYTTEEKIVISPNVIYETYEETAPGVKTDPSLTLRVTFFYTF